MAEEEQTTEQSTEEQTQEPQVGSFYSSLSEENRSNASADKFKNADADGAFKMYTDLQSMVGRKGIIPPNVNDEADAKRFWGEMGVPEEADKYELGKYDWAEKAGYDQSVMKQIAHGANLTPDQARKVEELYLQDIKAGIERTEAENKERLGEFEQQLRREWGARFDEKMSMADKVVEKFARSEATAAQLKGMMKGNPELAATLSDIGSQFAENRIGEFKAKAFTVSRQEAQDRIDAIYRDQSHPYFNDEDKKLHDDAVNEMNELMKIASGLG